MGASPNDFYSGGNSITSPRTPSIPGGTASHHPSWPNQPKYQPSKLSKETFRVVVIIRVPHHEADWQQGVTAADLEPIPEGSFISHPSNQSRADGHVSQWAYGHIFTKVRMMIVVALNDKHYLAIPLYTRKYIIQRHFLLRIFRKSVDHDSAR